jgi:hypothetical protein
VRFAAQQLKDAAQESETQETQKRNFMFSELEDSKIAHVEKEKNAQSVLTSVLADVQVAEVLIAAGQAIGEIGETGEKIDAVYLQESLNRLEETTQTLKQLQIVTSYSPDHPCTDLKTFQKCSHETLKTIVDQAKKGVEAIGKGLQGIDKISVLPILAELGSKIQQFPGIGDLVRQGIHMMGKAINDLARLLKEKIPPELTEKIQQVWQDFTNGQSLNVTLTWAFGIESIQNEIDQLLPENEAAADKLEKAYYDLIELTKTYQEKMTIVQKFGAVVSPIGALLAFTPLVNQGLSLFMASTYLTILAVILLIGMDYSDGRGAFGVVNGVGKIVQYLLE